MLRLVEEYTVELEKVKCVTVYFKRGSKTADIEIIETTDGETNVIVMKNEKIFAESYGYMYVKEKDICVNTPIDDNEKLNRIIICNSRLTNKRILEIIELKSGKILVETFKKNLLFERVDAEALAEEFKKVLTEKLNKMQ